jgi:hypothetical protein
MHIDVITGEKTMDEVPCATVPEPEPETVDFGMRNLLQLRKQVEIRKLRGKLQWQGDFDHSRTESSLSSTILLTS